MNIEKRKFKTNYIKLDFRNKNKVKNESDIDEEELDLKTVIESFEQQITLEELNSVIYKLIPKNINDLFKINIQQSKQYKKQYPFTKQNLINSVKRILASDFKSNFAFNKQNLEDISRILSHIFEKIKSFNINNEKTLKERINNIKLNIKDIFNMFIDIEMMNEKKSEMSYRMRNKLKTQFYSIQNPKYFNSTGNLPTVHELKNEENENEDNNKDRLTSSKKNKNDKISSSNLESENDEKSNESRGKNTIFKKIKNKSVRFANNIFNKNINNNKIRKQLFTKENKILVTKEYFIYPENNYGLDDKKLDLPIELIILIKKFEKIKIITFQIRDVDKKSIIENIYLLFNINFLFPNFTEIKIDLNDEKLQRKINNIYEMRGQDLLKMFKKDMRIYQYKQDYQARTVNCWEAEGDISFITEINDDNDIKYKYTSFGNNYVLGENPFENTNFFGNNLKSILLNEIDNCNSEKTTTIKYIIPKRNKNISFLSDEPIDEYSDEGSDDASLRTHSIFPTIEKSNYILPLIRNKSLSNLQSNFKSKINLKEEKPINNKKRKRTIPELLAKFIRDNESPFEMILIYSWFLNKISNIKTLSLYFYDSFSLETEFFLRKEDIRFDGFHFLFFINQIKELTEVNFSFNSLDTRSFENILGLIDSNKNISKLRINFFNPNINFNITSLLKLCSIMKLSLRTMFREQKLTYYNEKEPKDLEMEYFILNHKLEFFFEKNICCLFNIINKNININNYEEIVFRFDLPLLILSCDKYIIIIIKFIVNILNLITYTTNKINTFKLLSPELILDGRITPCLRDLFKELDNDEYKSSTNNIDNNNSNRNKSLKILNLQCKIYGIPNIFNLCLYNNISGLINVNIRDLDLESFIGFLDDYKKYIDKMKNLMSLKLGLINIIISYDIIENKIKEFINIKSINLKEKVLFSYLEFDNIEQINDLRKAVQNSKTDKLVIEIGQCNQILLNDAEFEEKEKYKSQLESLYLIMTTKPYNILVKDKIIHNLKKYFRKNDEKIVVCKPFFLDKDLY